MGNSIGIERTPDYDCSDSCCSVFIKRHEEPRIGLVDQKLTTLEDGTCNLNLRPNNPRVTFSDQLNPKMTSQG